MLCDGPCGRWQHRICGTGIDRATYRRAVRGDIELDWRCQDCVAVAQSELSLTQQAEMDVGGVGGDDESEADSDDEPDRDGALAELYLSQHPEMDGGGDDEPDADTTEPSFAVPMELEEPSLLDEPVVSDAIDDDQGDVTFEVIPRATKRGHPLLVDSDGYTYGVHRQGRGVVTWRCTTRNRTVKCSAMVRQEGAVFTPRQQSHQHAAGSGTAVKAKLSRDVKDMARDNPFQSAYTIAETLLHDTQRVPNQRPIEYLGRNANNHRQRSRPKHPTDLDFEFLTQHAPEDFEFADIRAGTRRHLLFYTKQQAHLLSKARRWFVDATFKVVKAPFTQLWSIHAFARVDDQLKQLPLAFALMSGKRRYDYRCVIKALKTELRRHNETDGLPWAVEGVVADFEAAVWQAFRHESPDVDVRGCGFHWGQAVWRKIQDLGLQSAYNTDPAMHRYCRQIFALPCLPWEKIQPTLAELEGEATTDGQRRICAYVRHTWLETPTWPPASWSVFYRTIRTNNDVEGWHRRLNTKATRGQLNMYLLLNLLGAEASLVDINVILLRESAVVRRQRSAARTTTARLFRMWDRLIAHEKTPRQTLRAASHLMPL